MSRLRKPAQFQQVFDAQHSIHSRYFSCHYSPNQLSIARLGVITSKRNVRFAVWRNRIRRQIKEWFRHNKDEHSGLDLVIIARRSSAQVNPQELKVCLEKLGKKLARQSRRS